MKDATLAVLFMTHSKCVHKLKLFGCYFLIQDGISDYNDDKFIPFVFVKGFISIKVTHLCIIVI